MSWDDGDEDVSWCAKQDSGNVGTGIFKER